MSRVRDNCHKHIEDIRMVADVTWAKLGKVRSEMDPIDLVCHYEKRKEEFASPHADYQGLGTLCAEIAAKPFESEMFPMVRTPDSRDIETEGWEG